MGFVTPSRMLCFHYCACPTCKFTSQEFYCFGYYLCSTWQDGVENPKMAYCLGKPAQVPVNSISTKGYTQYLSRQYDSWLQNLRIRQWRFCIQNCFNATRLSFLLHFLLLELAQISSRRSINSWVNTGWNSQCNAVIKQACVLETYTSKTNYEQLFQVGQQFWTILLMTRNNVVPTQCCSFFFNCFWFLGEWLREASNIDFAHDKRHMNVLLEPPPPLRNVTHFYRLCHRLRSILLNLWLWWGPWDIFILQA